MSDSMYDVVDRSEYDETLFADTMKFIIDAIAFGMQPLQETPEEQEQQDELLERARALSEGWQDMLAKI